MNEDLKWIAENVHEWNEKYDMVSVGEFCFGKTEVWFRQKEFESGTESYTRAQWQAACDELSGKPSWDDAPEWAEWLAQDENGSWFFYELEPVRDHEEFFREPGSNGKRSLGSVSTGPVLGDWRNTLERRPECTQSTEKSTEGEGMSNEWIDVEMRHVVNDEVFSSAGIDYIIPAGSTVKMSVKRNGGTWRGPEDGLPPVGIRVELHNDQGYYLDYMQSAIGEEVTVKAVFYSGDSNIPMVAVETDDKTCGCFRVAMLKPCKTEEDRAVEEMVRISMQTPMIQSLNQIETAHRDACRALYRAGLRFPEDPKQ